MGTHSKEYPVRYSLAPEAARAVAAHLKKKRGAPLSEIKRMALSNGVAQKTILELMDRISVPVLPEKPKNSQNAPAKSRHLQMAESFFSAPSVESREPTSCLSDEPSLDELVDLEKSLRAELAQKRETFRAEQDSSLRILAETEAEMRRAVAQAEAERERAERAIAQTATLRSNTKGDRDRLEELSGNYNVLKRRLAEVTEHVCDGARREMVLLMELQHWKGRAEALEQRMST